MIWIILLVLVLIFLIKQMLIPEYPYISVKKLLDYPLVLLVKKILSLILGLLALIVLGALIWIGDAIYGGDKFE